MPIAIGLGLELSQTMRVQNAKPINPATLFASAQVGAWYDPSDLTTLFQDIAGTTPVTTDGQTVGKMLDKSGNGNHIVALSDAARPIFHTSGGKFWLQSDGVDDIMRVNFTLTQPYTRMSAFRQLTWVLGARLMAGGSTTNASALFQNGVSPQLSLYSGAITTALGGAALNTDRVLIEVYNSTSSSLQVDNQEAFIGDSGTMPGAGITLFAASNNSVFGSANFYGAVIRAGVLTATQIRGLKRYFAAKSGAAL